MQRQRGSAIDSDGFRTLFVLAIVTLAACGCTVGGEFRAAALPAIRGGVSAILNGLVDGVFAAVEPDSAEPDPLSIP